MRPTVAGNPGHAVDIEISAFVRSEVWPLSHMVGGSVIWSSEGTVPGGSRVYPEVDASVRIGLHWRRRRLLLALPSGCRRIERGQRRVISSIIGRSSAAPFANRPEATQVTLCVLRTSAALSAFPLIRLDHTVRMPYTSVNAARLGRS
jgi:hypothetical protein